MTGYRCSSVPVIKYYVFPLDRVPCDWLSRGYSRCRHHNTVPDESAHLQGEFVPLIHNGSKQTGCSQESLQYQFVINRDLPAVHANAQTSAKPPLTDLLTLYKSGKPSLAFYVSGA